MLFPVCPKDLISFCAPIYIYQKASPCHIAQLDKCGLSIFKGLSNCMVHTNELKELNPAKWLKELH